MISSEELAMARKQLQEQVEAMPDGPQKEQARQQLAGMSDEAISQMVEQSRSQQASGGQVSNGQASDAQPQRSIFRMIVSGDVPSKKIDENKDAIAVVSIRPVSKGHVIVIPRRPAPDVRDLPNGALSLAKTVAKKLITRMGATRTEIQTSSAFDEVIVNAIPVYDKPVNVNSPAYEAEEDELNEVYDLLRVVKKPKKKVIKSGKKGSEDKVLKLKRRVP